MEQKKLEQLVGSFVLAALLVIGILVILFGRVTDRFQSSYRVTVHFPNASDLIPDATVSLAGAPIGRVSGPPTPVGEGLVVAVPLDLNAGVKIREDARFVIATKGLLGDRYVDVHPREQAVGQEKPYLQDGSVVMGDRFSGISELADDARPIMEQMKEIVFQLKYTSRKVNEEILTPETAADARESLKKLKVVLTRMDDLLAQAQQGKGPLAKLLNDPKLAADLTAFIRNIREHGVLFYSDSAVEDSKEKEPTSKSSSEARPRRGR